MDMPDPSDRQCDYSHYVEGLEKKIEDLELSVGMELSKSNDYWRLIMEMREGLQTIFAMNGEDELIAKICSPLIDRSAN